MTILIVGTLMMGGIILILRPDVNLDLAAAAVAFAGAALLGLGVGAVNCVLFGLFPTWANVWSVLTKPLFLLSGIFFLFETAPPAFQSILWWNPLVHVIGVMRTGFYGSYRADFASLPYVFGVALTLFVVGAYLLRRHASLLLEQ
jgi:capsular polysaccharide transport system permease protein